MRKHDITGKTVITYCLNMIKPNNLIFLYRPYMIYIIFKQEIWHDCTKKKLTWNFAYKIIFARKKIWCGMLAMRDKDLTYVGKGLTEFTNSDETSYLRENYTEYLFIGCIQAFIHIFMIVPRYIFDFQLLTTNCNINSLTKKNIN